MLTILYQDDYIVAVDKPAGLFVHRSYMDKDEIYFALQLVRDQIGQYVYPVHRLDRPTSGVLLFALSKEVASKLSDAFANKTGEASLNTDGENKQRNEDNSQELSMAKTYYALVRGHLNAIDEQGNIVDRGVIDYPLKEKLDKLGDKYVSHHKEAQQAKSFFSVVKQATLPIPLGKYDTIRYSLVKLTPVTGRRHQLRRHLAHLRHPIIGDINYGDNKQNPFFIQHFGFKRLMLIAKSLQFNHPVTGKRVIIEVKFDKQWQSIFNQFNWSVVT
ncbi:tRNA pseudouridine(65) synthase TruC [Litorilituus lipolyticus]|uniref:tRNA pseudouridine synthase C n=1 Tax=Litorilituus lipolyticus TaxID=2491017 RepID=A0A502KUX3_9GAMM|nr:tRNA pseudouridine(65) synthase TruC [Litorilituus lipolyticus]